MSVYVSALSFSSFFSAFFEARLQMTQVLCLGVAKEEKTKKEERKRYNCNDAGALWLWLWLVQNEAPDEGQLFYWPCTLTEHLSLVKVHFRQREKQTAHRLTDIIWREREREREPRGHNITTKSAYFCGQTMTFIGK